MSGVVHLGYAIDIWREKVILKEEKY